VHSSLACLLIWRGYFEFSAHLYPLVAGRRLDGGGAVFLRDTTSARRLRFVAMYFFIDIRPERAIDLTVAVRFVRP
jgi:hypothetical protein